MLRVNGTFDHLMVLGRPACGKSEFIDFMAHTPADVRLARYHIGSFEVVDDFAFLWEKGEEDDIWERLGCPRLFSEPDDTGYRFKDDVVWAFLVEKIDLEVTRRFLSQGPAYYRDHTVLIEFSRGGETAYREALARLSRPVLARAAILYIDVSFAESLRRNQARYDERCPAGTLTHSVPLAAMHSVYRADDWHDLTGGEPAGYLTVRDIAVPHVTMHNEPESTDSVVLDARYGEALRTLKRLYDECPPVAL